MTKEEMLLDLAKTTIFSYAENKRMIDELSLDIQLELAYKLCKKQLGYEAIQILKLSKEMIYHDSRHRPLNLQ